MRQRISRPMRIVAPILLFPLASKKGPSQPPKGLLSKKNCGKKRKITQPGAVIVVAAAQGAFEQKKIVGENKICSKKISWKGDRQIDKYGRNQWGCEKAKNLGFYPLFFGFSWPFTFLLLWWKLPCGWIIHNVDIKKRENSQFLGEITIKASPPIFRACS